MVEQLCEFSKFNAATQEQDFGGIDFFFRNIPFDIKSTDWLPRSYESKNTGYPLFRWCLEHQDLDRFHNTNRIIIIIYKTKIDFGIKDANIIAEYIATTPIRGYFKNIKYMLKGKFNQDSHEKYGTKQTMDYGLLIHYKYLLGQNKILSYTKNKKRRILNCPYCKCKFLTRTDLKWHSKICKDAIIDNGHIIN